MLFLPLAGMAQEIQIFKIEKPISEEKHTEYAPTLSQDGQVLIFQSDNNKYQTWQIYQATSKGKGSWSKPKAIKNINEFGRVPELANKYQGDFIAGPCLSFDGKTLFFYATFEGAGGRDIFYSQWDGKEWKRPKNIGSPINTEDHEDCPSISADGKSLYFMRPTDLNNEGENCYQIFVSKKDRKGNWQEALPLPYPINTGCEKAPRIMADNVTLIFSSMRAGGMGNYDLYVSVKDIKGEWSEPKALEFINTPQFEQFVSIDAKEEYLIFNKMGEEKPDIFQAQPVPDYLKLVKYSPLVLEVRDSITQELIDANVKEILSDGTGFVVDSFETNRNILFTSLRHQHIFEIIVSAENYKTQSFEIDLTQRRDTSSIFKKIELAPIMEDSLPPALSMEEKEIYQNELTNILENKEAIAVYSNPLTGENIAFSSLEDLQDYLLQKEEENQGSISKNALNDANNNPFFQKYGNLIENVLADDFEYEKILDLQLPNVNFDENSFSLRKDAELSLNTILLLMQDRENYQLLLIAHTDEQGEEIFNQNLSEKRAETVYNFLNAGGIPKERLFAIGMGEKYPLLPNNSDSNREKNRRVELVIIF